MWKLVKFQTVAMLLCMSAAMPSRAAVDIDLAYPVSPSEYISNRHDHATYWIEALSSTYTFDEIYDYFFPDFNVQEALVSFNDWVSNWTIKLSHDGSAHIYIINLDVQGTDQFGHEYEYSSLFYNPPVAVPGPEAGAGLGAAALALMGLWHAGRRRRGLNAQAA